MKVRRAVSSDASVLAALNKSVQDMHVNAFPERFRRDTQQAEVVSAFEEMIEAPSAYWLLAEESQPIAFLSADFRDREESWCLASHRTCYLGGIVVEASYRRKGISRALFGELKQEAKRREAITIELDVWTFNETARQTFSRLGFRGIMERMQIKL